MATFSRHHRSRCEDCEGDGLVDNKNGELLALAAKEFDVFVTVDRNLSFQQNTPAFNIAEIVLQARSNRLADLQPLVPALLACIPNAKRGTVTYVGD